MTNKSIKETQIKSNDRVRNHGEFLNAWKFDRAIT